MNGDDIAGTPDHAASADRPAPRQRRPGEVDPGRSVELAAEPRYVFDPFSISPILRLFRGPAGLFGLLGLVAGLLILTGVLSYLDHGLGSLSDLRPVRELRLLVGPSDLNWAEPIEYPFLRDVAALIIIPAMVVQVFLLRTQWRMFAHATDDLVKSGAVIDHTRADGTSALSAVISKVGHTSIFTRVWPLVAAGVAGYYFVSAQNKGLFASLLPVDVSPEQRQSFVDQTYQQWWAGPGHPLGRSCAIVLASLAVYIIIIQTIGAQKMLLLLSQVPKHGTISADWLNGDGWFGWRSVRNIYLTIYATQSIYGILVTILLVTLGNQFGLLPGLVWLGFFAVYVAAPWLYFNRLEGQAKDRQIEIMRAEAAGTPWTSEQMARIQAQVDRVRAARLHPMRIPVYNFAGLLLTAVLPLTVEILKGPVSRWIAGH
ncbi:MAG TPA: hypothetical protein VF163_15830 [Micromonosporaceae bacterium]